MPVEVVVDASVAVKWFITEDGWEPAHALAASNASLIAPEFILAELASVAAKRLRRGDIGQVLAEEMVAAAPEFFTELAPLTGLRSRAFRLAAAHGLSVYDGLYVALADQREATLVTADRRLIARAQDAGLGKIVKTIA